MTITLHWWMAPIAIVVIGYIWAEINYRTAKGYLGGFESGFIFFISIIATIFITIGHFL
jgi:hypothetical protein